MDMLVDVLSYGCYALCSAEGGYQVNALGYQRCVFVAYMFVDVVSCNVMVGFRWMASSSRIPKMSL